MIVQVYNAEGEEHGLYKTELSQEEFEVKFEEAKRELARKIEIFEDIDTTLDMLLELRGIERIYIDYSYDM